jgi:hypothetical protein
VSAYSAEPGAEVEATAMTGVYDQFSRDPRYACGSKAPESLVVKDIASGLQFLVEVRVLPMGVHDGDG